MTKVAFATKCWDKDWKTMLAGGFERKIGAIGYPFHSKLCVLNNGVPLNIFDPEESVAVEEMQSQVLHYFRLKLDDFAGGEVYALGELTAVYCSNGSDYLCYCQGDCQTQGGDWVTPGIKVLEENSEVAMVSPASDVNTWHDPLTMRDHFCSDQAFLVRTKEFRAPIYNLKEPLLPEYPDHGKDSFERLVGRYLHATGRYRQILPEFYTIHGTC